MERASKVGHDKPLILLNCVSQPLGTILRSPLSFIFRTARYCTDGMTRNAGNHWPISVWGQGTAMK